MNPTKVIWWDFVFLRFSGKKQSEDGINRNKEAINMNIPANHIDGSIKV